MAADVALNAAWDLEDYIEAFEKAQARDANTDFVDFLPDSGHPLYAIVLQELIRSDMEFSYQRNTPRKPEDYFQRLPDISADRQTVKALAFEEYRLRRLAGEAPTPNEYQERFGFPIGICPRPGEKWGWGSAVRGQK